jgi:hypothetical protein
MSLARLVSAACGSCGRMNRPVEYIDEEDRIGNLSRRSGECSAELLLSSHGRWTAAMGNGVARRVGLCIRLPVDVVFCALAARYERYQLHVCAGFIYRCLISATVPGVSSRFDPCLDFGYRTNTKSDSKCLRLVSCHLHISISFLVPVPARDPILVPHVVSQHVPALPSHFRARRAPHDPARDLRL